jgi:hypothetical protein
MTELDKQKGSRLAKPLVFAVLFALAIASIIGYFVADHLDKEYRAKQSAELQEVFNTGLGIQTEKNLAQDNSISALLTAQQSLNADLVAYKSQNVLYVSSQVAELLETINNYANISLTVSTSFGGDVSGVASNLSISNNSHNHTGLTISDLSALDFSSPAISQWTNDIGYLTDSDAFVQGGNTFGEPAELGTSDDNNLALKTNNAVALQILSNGHIGIGTITPSNMLDISDPLTSSGLVSTFSRNNKTLGLYSNSTTFSIGTETNTGLGFYTNKSSSQMVLDTAGRLGIGVASPGARLEINSGILGTTGLKFSQVGSSTGTTFTNGKVLTLDESGNVILAVDQVGLSPEALPGGTVGQTIYHNGASWVATSNLYNSGGFIGIGTTDPQSMLHIYGTDNTEGDGITPQANSVIIDGVTDGDKSLVFADGGVNKWALQTYRNEAGEFLYFYNYDSQKEPLVLSEGGRLGLNNPSNIMNYHAIYAGGGSSYDMDVGGAYTGEFQLWYQAEIDGNAVPDTFRWRTSRDNLNWGSWTSNVAITGTEQDLSNGVTVEFSSTSDYVIGDSWTFTAFPQLPRATLSIGPGMFDEVLYYDGSDFSDNTADANTSGGVGMDLLTDTNDYTYFGRGVEFNSIYLNLTQAGANSTLVVEYWDGDSWEALTGVGNNLQDFTANLTQAGQITFDKSTMSDWAINTVSDYVDLYYWIRISSSTLPSTTPKFSSANPSANNRIGVYSSGLDTMPIFSVDGIGHTIVGDGLEVTGIADFASIIDAAGGVSVGVGQSYTGLGEVTLSSAAGEALIIDSGTTGDINIGTGANAKVITIGNTEDETSLDLIASTSAITLSTDSIDFSTDSTLALTIDALGNGLFSGNLTISSDKLYMNTNTTGSILVADGTNYNPVVMSGDATITAGGAIQLNYVAGQSASGSNKGFLTSADWTTFFNKQAALGFTAENATNKSTDLVADGASDTKYASAKAVKTYADNLALGLNWKSPAELVNVIGEANSPVGSPVNLDGYILNTGANTGAWAAFAAGDLVQYQGSAWVKIKSLAIGDYLGVAFKSSTVPVNDMAGKKNYYGEVTSGTPGNYSYTFTAPTNNDAVYVQNTAAYYHNVSFVYSSSLAEWVQLSAAVDYSFSSGLSVAGTVVSLGGLTTDWNQTGAFNIITAGDIGVNGGDVTTTATTASIFNTGATTLNIGGTATAINIGADGSVITGGGALTIRSATAKALTIDSGTTGALNIGTGANAKTITIGNASSTAVKIANLTTQYGVLYTGTSDGSLAQTAAGTTGQCLIGNTGGAPSWGSCAAAGGTFTRTGTNISPTIAGDDLLLNSGETLTIGGGTVITKHLSATAVLDFPAIPNNSCNSLTITVTGAAIGDSVYASPRAVSGGIETFANTSWNAYVSSTNTVTVRACKINTGTVDLPGQTWRVDIWQH